MAFRIKRGIQTAVEGGGFRARSNADVEQRVGAAESRALNLAASAAQQIGATVNQWHQIEKAADAERDRVDLTSATKKADTMMQTAAFEASKQNDPAEVERIMGQAMAESSDLIMPDLRSEKAQKMYKEWHAGRADQSQLQQKKILWNLENRKTAAKRQSTLMAFSDSASTPTELANNTADIKKFIDEDPQLIPEEKANAIAQWQNTTAYNYGNRLVDRIDLEEQSSFDNELALSELETFAEDNLEINSKQRAKLKEDAAVLKKAVHRQKLDEDVTTQINDSLPQSLVDVKEFSDRMGYQKSLKQAKADIDSGEMYKDYPKEDKDYIKGGVERQMQAQWKQIQNEKTAILEQYLADPLNNMGLIQSYKFTSPSERSAIDKVQQRYDRVHFTEKAADRLTANFNDYNYNPDDAGSLIQMISDIALQPPAVQKAYNMMLQDKIAMQKQGGPYGAAYQHTKAMLEEQLKLSGKDKTYEPTEIPGMEGEFTGEDRIILLQDRLSTVKELGKKYHNDPESFNKVIKNMNSELSATAALVNVLHIVRPEKIEEAVNDAAPKRSVRGASRARELENR